MTRYSLNLGINTGKSHSKTLKIIEVYIVSKLNHQWKRPILRCGLQISWPEMKYHLMREGRAFSATSSVILLRSLCHLGKR